MRDRRCGVHGSGIVIEDLGFRVRTEWDADVARDCGAGLLGMYSYGRRALVTRDYVLAFW